ncbi:unnamed protein product [Vitrella brassicaformis CCMP3155]|uniref:Uncharacterized protein n=4 Tax=Vitrella brassicaformis TaxID=1169539 RepID=A0A0G4EN97_VITBC|nr:unnamed protein product [Vitrella brassicaformis CCMP3155]|eukprot:CEL98306.1 unnamed protein product [Vitrella brassicaformis CCMP3155]
MSSELLRPRYGSFRSGSPVRESSAGVRAPEAGGEETWWQKLVRAVGVPLRRAARMAAEFCSRSLRRYVVYVTGANLLKSTAGMVFFLLLLVVFLIIPSMPVGFGLCYLLAETTTFVLECTWLDHRCLLKDDRQFRDFALKFWGLSLLFLTVYMFLTLTYRYHIGLFHGLQIGTSLSSLLSRADTLPPAPPVSPSGPSAFFCVSCLIVCLFWRELFYECRTFYSVFGWKNPSRVLVNREGVWGEELQHDPASTTPREQSDHQGARQRMCGQSCSSIRQAWLNVRWRVWRWFWRSRPWMMAMTFAYMGAFLYASAVGVGITVCYRLSTYMIDDDHMMSSWSILFHRIFYVIVCPLLRLVARLFLAHFLAYGLIAAPPPALRATLKVHLPINPARLNAALISAAQAGPPVRRRRERAGWDRPAESSSSQQQQQQHVVQRPLPRMMWCKNSISEGTPKARQEEPLGALPTEEPTPGAAAAQLLMDEDMDGEGEGGGSDPEIPSKAAGDAQGRQPSVQRKSSYLPPMFASLCFGDSCPAPGAVPAVHVASGRELGEGDDGQWGEESTKESKGLDHFVLYLDLLRFLFPFIEVPVALALFLPTGGFVFLAAIVSHLLSEVFFAHLIATRLKFDHYPRPPPPSNPFKTHGGLLPSFPPYRYLPPLSVADRLTRTPSVFATTVTLMLPKRFRPTPTDKGGTEGDTKADSVGGQLSTPTAGARPLRGREDRLARWANILDVAAMLAVISASPPLPTEGDRNGDTGDWRRTGSFQLAVAASSTTALDHQEGFDILLRQSTIQVALLSSMAALTVTLVLIVLFWLVMFSWWEGVVRLVVVMGARVVADVLSCWTLDKNLHLLANREVRPNFELIDFTFPQWQLPAWAVQLSRMPAVIYIGEGIKAAHRRLLMALSTPTLSVWNINWCDDDIFPLPLLVALSPLCAIAIVLVTLL